MRQFVNHFITLVLLICSLQLSAQRIADIPYLEMAEIGVPGKLVATLWTKSKKNYISEDQVCKDAIEVVIFKGVYPNTDRRMLGRDALVSPNIDRNDPYWKAFFNSKEYMDYCRVGIEGYVEQGNILKIKGGYAIGKLVVIDYNMLRQKLENDKIIKKLYE